MREAVTEYKSTIDAVRAAICAKVYPFNADGRWVNLEAVYADKAIYTAEDGKLYQFNYSIDDALNITLGDPVAVVEQFVPLKEATLSPTPLPEGEGKIVGDDVFLEAQGEASSGKWLIRVIRAGLSGNNNYYSDAVLRESAPLFENARVFEKSDDEHIAGKGKDVKNLIGRLTTPKFTEGKTPDSGDITATFENFRQDAERVFLLSKLRENGWNVAETARALEMPRSNLYKKIEKYQLSREET